MAFKDHWLSSLAFPENSTLKLMDETARRFTMIVPCVLRITHICTFEHYQRQQSVVLMFEVKVTFKLGWLRIHQYPIPVNMK
jgi:hypothetical protein